MKMAEQMLFALLRASLHNRQIETSYFKGVSDKDWEQCFRLAKSQGVMALAWDGILKLPSALQPPLELKLQWGIKVEAQEKKYQRYCHTIHELTSFYQEHQIATLQLKGVGESYNSYYYGIDNIEEARAYLQHPVLGARLREITEVFLQSDKSAKEIFGGLDAMKVRSCMTLFNEVADDDLFTKVLDKHYKGEQDKRTLDILRSRDTDNF